MLERFKHFAIIYVALLCCSLCDAATVSSMPGPCPHSGGCLLLDGPIAKDDLRTLGEKLSFAASNKRSIAVRLNSEGGDFRVAIALGRLMRQAGAIAVGGATDICMSSCVMILAGATFRGHAGRVGIHRPYRLSTTQISAPEMQKEFDTWDTEARRFLKEVNVPTRLWDEMIRISPEKVKVLTTAELISLGLEGEDPVSEEITDSENARRLGLPKQEYLK